MKSVEENASGGGLRERKKQERKQALYRAAADLSLTKGYTNVTVEDICERCDVSVRTFFNYFSSKEEAVIGRDDIIFDDEDQPAVNEFENGGPSGDLLNDFRVLLASVVDTRSKTREDLKRHLQLLRSDATVLQTQLERMDNNMRLFRQLIQRRLAHDSGVDVGSGSGDQDLGSVLDTVFGRRAQVLAGLGVTVLRLTVERVASDSSDIDATAAVPAIFDELHQLFTQENR